MCYSSALAWRLRVRTGETTADCQPHGCFRIVLTKVRQGPSSIPRPPDRRGDLAGEDQCPGSALAPTSDASVASALDSDLCPGDRMAGARRTARSSLAGAVTRHCGLHWQRPDAGRPREAAAATQGDRPEEAATLPPPVAANPATRAADRGCCAGSAAWCLASCAVRVAMAVPAGAQKACP